MDAPADLMECGHPKGCIVSTETDSACGWCQALEPDAWMKNSDEFRQLIRHRTSTGKILRKIFT